MMMLIVVASVTQNSVFSCGEASQARWRNDLILTEVHLT